MPKKKTTTISPVKSKKSRENENFMYDLDEESEYVKERQNRISEHKKYLQELNIGQVKEEFLQTVAKPRRSVTKRTPKRPSSPLPRRFSLRLQQKPPEAKPVTTEVAVYEEEIPRLKGTLEMSSIWENDESKCEDVIDKLMSHFKPPKKSVMNGRKGLMSQYKKLNVKEVCKVVPNRIFSLKFHSTPSRLLIFAGDKKGYIGLWDVDGGDDCVHQWKPHIAPVNCITVCQLQPSRIYTTSYEGCFRSADFTKMEFQEVYAVPDDEDVWTSWHCPTSANTFLVARGDGTVASVDFRTINSMKKAEQLYLCAPVKARSYGMKCVDVHPTQKNYFVTATRNGMVNVWDERMLSSRKNNSVCSMPHTRHVPSAFFSPVTGNSILTSCMDNKIRLYDFHDNSANLIKTINHNNYTGRWLTPFKPMWHPNSDEMFSSGSMEHPRRIELFSGDGDLCVNLKGELLASVCSINDCHVSQLVMAGGNSSGRVHLFT